MRPSPLVRTLLASVLLAACTTPGPIPEDDVGATRERAADDAAVCRTLVDEVGASYAALRSALPPAERSGTSAVWALATLEREACDTEPSVTLDVVERALGEHSGRIGVIVPDDPAFEAQVSALLEGVRAASSTFFGGSRVVYRTASHEPAAVDRALAELVFQEGVAVVAGGLGRSQAQQLASWGGRLRLPLFVLNGSAAVDVAGTDAFKVFPTQAALAEAIAGGVAARDVRRVAFLRPEDGSADGLYTALERALRAAATPLVGTANYRKVDAESLAMALESLKEAGFGVSGGEGLDALVFPDNFRMARHVARLLRFHGLGRILLIGDQQWRSPALVSPPEPRLEGALFADFIGSYAALPSALRTYATEGDAFIAPENAVRTDYLIIGHRTGRLAARVLGEERRRDRMAERLRHLGNDDDGYFPAGEPAFDEAQVSTWPAYLFEVRDGTIRQVSGVRGRPGS